MPNLARSRLTRAKIFEQFRRPSRRSLRSISFLWVAENVWQYLRQNGLSNTVFDNYDAIIDAARDAWRRLIAQPEKIKSIGIRKWAKIGQPS